MKMSYEGLIALIGHEGIVLSRYKDSKGIWTIGVGHTAAAGGLDPQKFYGKLSVEEVLDMLAIDIAKYEKRVNNAIKVKVAQHEYDAAVSFDYNTGAIHKATWVQNLNAGDRKLAAKNFMNWKKPPEIIDRRTAERDLFRDGIYPAPTATIYPATADGRVQWGQGKRVNVKDLLAPKAPAKAPIPEPKPEPKPEPQPQPKTVWAWIKSWFA